MHGDAPFHLVNERASSFADHRSVRAVDAMHQFGHRIGIDRHFHFAGALFDVLPELLDQAGLTELGLLASGACLPESLKRAVVTEVNPIAAQ